MLIRIFTLVCLSLEIHSMTTLSAGTAERPYTQAETIEKLESVVSIFSWLLEKLPKHTFP